MASFSIEVENEKGRFITVLLNEKWYKVCYYKKALLKK